MAKLYPITVSVTIAITDGDRRGSVDYSLPAERIPTHEDIDKALAEAVGAVPDGFRLMTRHEHMLHRIEERLGFMQRFAMNRLQNGDVWHDPDSSEVYCDWGSDEDEDG